MKLIKRKDTKESIKLREKERKKIIRILCNATVLYLFAKHIVYIIVTFLVMLVHITLLQQRCFTIDV